MPSSTGFGYSSDDPVTGLELIDRTQPDLVIVDISLRRGHGLGLIEQARTSCPSTRALVFSLHDEALYAERAAYAGASGYVSKNAPTDVFLAAVRRVLAGKSHFSEPVTERLLDRLSGSSHDGFSRPLNQLSNRELEVFEEIGRGKTTQEIADSLVLSSKTVDTYRQRVKKKLGIANNSELERFAVEYHSIANRQT